MSEFEIKLFGILTEISKELQDIKKALESKKYIIKLDGKKIFSSLRLTTDDKA